MIKIQILPDETYAVLSTEKPVVGQQYVLENATSGTLAQNNFFHKIVSCYFNSGCFSDNASTAKELKDELKKRIGVGYGPYRVDRESGIPKWVRTTEKKREQEFLVSWSDYTKKERMEFIKELLNEMIMVGVDGKEFEGLIETANGF